MLLLLTGTSTISPLQALDSMATWHPDPVHFTTERSGITQAIEQNTANLSSEFDAIFSTSLANLMQLAYFLPEGKELDTIKQAIEKSMATASDPAFRFKAHVALLTLEDDQFHEWMHGKVRMDRQMLIQEMVLYVQSKLIGEYYRDTP